METIAPIPKSVAPTQRFDASNAEQAGAWDGAEGSLWAAHHDIFEAALERYQPAFLAAAAIEPGDRVLDVGCGTGVSTRGAAALAGDGDVVGVDLSSEMVTVARQLAQQQGLANVSFLRTDAQVHPFEADSFDVVISRTGSMFFGDPNAAFTNLQRSLRPNGRLVLLTWQHVELQEWATAFTLALTGRVPPAPNLAAPGPFSLSDPDHVRGLLGETGFIDVDLTPLRDTMGYGNSVEAAHALLTRMLGWMVDDQGATGGAAALEALRTTLEAHQTTDGIRFDSAVWLVTARRQHSS